MFCNIKIINFGVDKFIKGMPIKFRSPIIRTKAAPVKKAATTSSKSFLYGANVAQWTNIQQYNELAKAFSTNPVVYSVITLYANLLTNGRVAIKDLKTNQIITKANLTDRTKDIPNLELVKKAFRLIENPNPLQSFKEFFGAGSIMKNVFGNEFMYGNSGSSTVDLRSVEAIWNLYPQYMGVKMKGEYFNATDEDEIIDKWIWDAGIYKPQTYNPGEILQRKEININLNGSDDLIFGKSRLISQKWPISNIEKAYESENVVLQHRGARLLISLKGKIQDEISGIEPAEPDDKTEVQTDWDEYGLGEDQKQAFITRMPVDVTVIDQDIRKLGIFETIANDSMSINNAYGIAHDLAKLWIQGSTFENQSEGEIRTYQDAIIPEFEDKINDMDQWLQMEKFGLKYVPTFAHIRVLQTNEKEKATTLNLVSKVYENMFTKGAIVLDVWLNAVDLPPDPKFGNKRIFDFSPEELQKIGVNINTGGTNDN